MGRAHRKSMPVPTEITLELPEPDSLNALIRMHHRKRSALRDKLTAEIRRQRPRGWVTLSRYEVDAEMRLFSLRDPLELPACLKVIMDACIRAQIITDDGPKNCVPGEVTQTVDRKNRGVTITIRAYVDPEKA